MPQHELPQVVRYPLRATGQTSLAYEIATTFSVSYFRASALDQDERHTRHKDTKCNTSEAFRYKQNLDTRRHEKDRRNRTLVE